MVKGLKLARRLFLALLISVFAAEVLATHILAGLRPAELVFEALLDGIAVTVLVFPLVYLFHLRPLLRAMREEAAARAQLDELNQSLEQIVAERTNGLAEANRKLALEVEERRASQTQLQRSRDLMQRILEANQALVFICDLEHGRCDYANDQMEDLLGYTPDAVYSMGSDFTSTVLDREVISTLLRPGGALSEAQDRDVVSWPLWLADAGGDRWIFDTRMVVSREEGDLRPRSVLCIATPRQWREGSVTS